MKIPTASPFPPVSRPARLRLDIDPAMLKVEHDTPLPRFRSRTSDKYGKLFGSLKPGSCIRCEPSETPRISNAVDLNQREAREARYMARIKRYEPAEQALFPQMLAALVDRLEAGPDDVLGRLFGELELGNDARGQFFTPYEVCRLMARMQIGDPAAMRAKVEENGFITVNEPACGAGAMMIAFSEAMREAGLNPQQQMHATCQDIDSRGVHMCYLQLALLHIPATIVLGNTLTVEVREVWHTPAHVMGGWTWKLRRGRNPLIQPANDNAPVQVQPEQPKRAIGEQIGLF